MIMRPIEVRGRRLPRNELFRCLWESAARTWDPRYDDDAAALLRFAIGRVAGVMSNDRTLDCAMLFERVSLSSIVFGRADAPSRDAPDGGYPALREFLKTDSSRDAAPVCGARRDGQEGYVIWDGRHRYKTYVSAGRTDIPTWSATFSNGCGLLSVGPARLGLETAPASPV